MKGRNNLTNIKKNIKKDIGKTINPKNSFSGSINLLKSYKESKSKNPIFERLRKDNMNLAILNSRANILLKKNLNPDLAFSIHEKITNIENVVFSHSQKMITLERIIKEKGNFAENVGNSYQIKKIVEIDKKYKKYFSEVMKKSNQVDNLNDLNKLLTYYEKLFKTIL